MSSKSTSDREAVNLPVRPFLYTLDQVATILNMTEASLKNGGYLFFVNRTPGAPRPDEMKAHNIASGINARPEWRVEERELVRWMKRKGFRFID